MYVSIKNPRHIGHDEAYDEEDTDNAENNPYGFLCALIPKHVWRIL